MVRDPFISTATRRQVERRVPLFLLLSVLLNVVLFVVVLYLIGGKS